MNQHVFDLLKNKLENICYIERPDYKINKHLMQQWERSEFEECNSNTSDFVPREILEHILTYLNFQNVLKIGSVNKTWYLASSNDRLWTLFIDQWDNNNHNHNHNHNSNNNAIISHVNKVNVEQSPIHTVIKNAKWKFVKQYYDGRDAAVQQRDQLLSLRRSGVNNHHQIFRNMRPGLVYDPLEMTFATPTHMWGGYAGIFLVGISSYIISIFPSRFNSWFSKETVLYSLITASALGAIARYVTWDAYYDEKGKYKWKSGRFAHSAVAFLTGCVFALGAVRDFNRHEDTDDLDFENMES